MHTKIKRYSAIILCIYFILISIFSVIYIAKETDHDCLGEQCPICESIHTVKENLEGFLLIDIGSAVITVLPILFFMTISFIAFVILRATPVTQKTRMDH